jgi:hypothetical protein
MVAERKSKSFAFVDQRPNERLRSDDFVSVRLGQLGARIADFSFKSATKLGHKWVYELTEKSTI